MFKNLLVTWFVLSLLVTSAFADAAPSKIDTVIVTGVGLDADKARQNAVRNAVEQVVGTYVKSDTLISNGALIKDEILSHSGGYVQQTRILSTNTSEGLVTVQLEAVVVSSSLIRKLEDLNIATKKINNEGLFSAALSKIDTDRSKTEETVTGKDLMESVLKKFPGGAYQITIGEVSILSASDAEKTAKVKIPLKILWDDQFLNDLMAAMKHTSYVSSEFEDLIETKKRFSDNEPKDMHQFRYCFTEKSVLIDLTPEYCGVLSIKSFVDRSPTAKFVRLMRGGHEVKAKLKVSFKGDGNKTLKAIYHALKSDNYKQQGMDRIRSSRIGSLDSLTYTPPSGNMPNGIDGPYGKIILKDGEYHTDVVTELNVDMVKKIKSISVVMEADKEN